MSSVRNAAQDWTGHHGTEQMTKMEEHELITYEIICVILLLIALALVLASKSKLKDPAFFECFRV